MWCKQLHWQNIQYITSIYDNSVGANPTQKEQILRNTPVNEVWMLVSWEKGKDNYTTASLIKKNNWTALLFLCEFCLFTNFQSRLSKYRATKLHQCVYFRALKQSWINSASATTIFFLLSGSIIALAGFLSPSMLKWKHGVESSD